MDELKGQVHLSGPLLGPFWIFFPQFLKDITFLYCLSGKDIFFCPQLFPPVYFLRLGAKFLCNSWLGITVLLQKIQFKFLNNYVFLWEAATKFFGKFFKDLYKYKLLLLVCLFFIIKSF